MSQKLRFLKSAAKLLYHTAKTCQYINIFFIKKQRFFKTAAKIIYIIAKLRQRVEENATF